MIREVTTASMLDLQRDMDARQRLMIRVKPIWIEGKEEGYAVYHVARPQ